MSSPLTKGPRKRGGLSHVRPESEVAMPDRCDRCCAKPHVWWAPLTTDLDEQALFLCHEHSREHAEALVQAGWVRVAEEAQASGAV